MGGRDIFGDVGWPILSVLALVAASYVLLVYIVGRIRLTDWLGYIVAAGAAVRAVWALTDASVWAVAVGVPLAFILALWWARGTVKAYQQNPELVLTGFFTVERPPQRVKDWPDRTQFDKDKPRKAEE